MCRCFCRVLGFTLLASAEEPPLPPPPPRRRTRSRRALLLFFSNDVAILRAPNASLYVARWSDRPRRVSGEVTDGRQLVPSFQRPDAFTACSGDDAGERSGTERTSVSVYGRV